MERPFFPTASTGPEKTNQTQAGQAASKESAVKDPRSSVARSEQSQGVFEDFAEFTDLRRAHGALFAWCGEIVIDALFEIPFEQLHTLLHAHFFRTTASCLVQFL